MYKTELVLIKRDAAADMELTANQSAISDILYQHAAELNGTSTLSPAPKKITDYVIKRIGGGDTELFVFMNVLDMSGAEGFRRLFYDLIGTLEKSVRIDKEHKNLRPVVKVSSLGELGGGCKGYCFSFGGRRFVALPQVSMAGKAYESLTDEALQKADEIFERQRERYPEGIAFVDKKGVEADPELNRVSPELLMLSSKQGFIQSFIPQKSDTSKQKARKIAVLLAIVAFIGAGIYVLNFYVFAPMRNNAITSEIQEIAYSGESKGDGKKDGSAQDWKALKKINEEIVGWITIPDTVIDYPVLEHKGDDRYNQYYLERSYKKDGTEYGSIFLDYRSTDSVKSRNVIMHGHNMRDGSQFHSLLNYSHEGSLKADLDYYRDHPVITFNTPDGDAKYKIISIFKTSTRYEDGEFFNYMQGEFNSDAEFMNFVYHTRIRSMVNTPVTCNEGDQIITLSTCCYEFYQWRCVVVARKVRPGEDPGVDVKLAELNDSPLFPESYYERYGGTRPDPGTFKSANGKGKIGWYDGKGNLEGSEVLTATAASNPTEPPTEKPKPGETIPTEPPVVTYYPVTFRNFDGTQYAAYNVKEGDPLPIPDGVPKLPSDDYYNYTFKGWNLDIPGVDINALNVGLDIYPKVESTPKE